MSITEIGYEIFHKYLEPFYKLQLQAVLYDGAVIDLPLMRGYPIEENGKFVYKSRTKKEHFEKMDIIHLVDSGNNILSTSVLDQRREAKIDANNATCIVTFTLTFP